jgi:hypothetical protein
MHATDSHSVADGFPEGLSLVSEPSHISQLAGLITHVYGEHLGQFQKGRDLIVQLMTHPLLPDEKRGEMRRFEATLFVAENYEFDVSSFSVSDQIRMLATASSCNIGLGKSDIATVLHERAVLLSAELSTDDPANRTLAMTSNNVACSLEEKAELTDLEKNLMLTAAHSSRKFWAIAGTWLQVQRAEYRLANCYLKAGDILNSIKHANLCLTICEENAAPAVEMFYAYEAVALVEKKMKQAPRSLPQMEKYFNLLTDEEKSWCEKSLQKVKS